MDFEKVRRVVDFDVAVGGEYVCLAALDAFQRYGDAHLRGSLSPGVVLHQNRHYLNNFSMLQRVGRGLGALQLEQKVHIK